MIAFFFAGTKGGSVTFLLKVLYEPIFFYPPGQSTETFN